MTARLARVNLFVRHIERARHFYTRALGYRVIREEPGACYLGSGGPQHELALFEFAPDAFEPPLAIGCRSIGFEVPSRAALVEVCDRLSGARFTVLDNSGAWVVHTTDPDGNRIEIFCDAGDAVHAERRGTRAVSREELRAEA